MNLLDHLEDAKVMLNIQCPICESRGHFGVSENEIKSCPNCRGASGQSYQVDVPLSDFIILLEERNLSDPVSLSEQKKYTRLERQLKIELDGENP